MKRVNGYIGFGFFNGMGYRECDDVFEDYLNYHNTLLKSTVSDYMRTLPMSVSSFPVTDIFTGKHDGNGALYNDGPFTFPVQFLRYYETYDIGIPPEYEDYLIHVVGLK